MAHPGTFWPSWPFALIPRTKVVAGTTTNGNFFGVDWSITLTASRSFFRNSPFNLRCRLAPNVLDWVRRLPALAHRAVAVKVNLPARPPARPRPRDPRHGSALLNFCHPRAFA